MADAGHFRATLLRFWPLYVSLAPGVVIGLLLLDRTDPLIASGALGVVLLTYCVISLSGLEMELRRRLERPLNTPIGLTTGLINGLLLSLRLDANRFVQAINCSGCVSSVALIVGLSRLGIMTSELVLISAASLIPVFFGVQIGNRVRRLLSPTAFRTAVLLVMVVLALTLLARPFVGG